MQRATITVLYVEDEADVRNSFTEILMRRFDQVYEAENGQQGYKLFQLHKPDLVITDLNMPIMDGLAMISKIKEFNPEQLIIITSAFSEQERLLKAIALGVTRYLIKPIKSTAIRTLLQEVKELILLRNEQRLKQQVFDQIDDMVLVTDTEGTITFVNQQFETQTGYSQDSIIGQSCNILKSGHHTAEFYQSLWRTVTNGGIFKERFINRKQNGELFHEQKTISPIFDTQGHCTGFLSTGKDITRFVQQDEKIAWMASHDQLTGLYNRYYFETLLQTEITRAIRYLSPFSLIMIDIDYYKTVNDNYGHSVGDQLLVEFAMLMNDASRESDSFCRWGGEEFLVLLPQTNQHQAYNFAEKLRKLIEQQLFVAEIRITVSFGVTGYITAEEKDCMIKRVDKALYLAKESGRNRVETITADYEQSSSTVHYFSINTDYTAM